MEIKITCPLGSQCETAKDGYIERCAWNVEIEGTSSNNGEEIKESRCAMAWMPLLQIENTAKTIGINEAICSAREENIKRQDMGLSLQIQSMNQPPTLLKDIN